ncbi:hypothetical protein ACFT4A_17490 [Streptomyces sp. NPDC057099]|uniref:hypothetical protein n=1 Tax=Streptomyces sp. NPDC057099 TaxID=3346019 RepID=UPI00362B6167
MRALGARFLPVPVGGELEVGAESVAEFLGEMALLRDHPDAITGRTQRRQGSRSTARGW